jgi:hypothetical protein
MARTLAEAYQGMLSRDWDTLLTILETGEQRVQFYRHTFPSGKQKEMDTKAWFHDGVYCLHGVMVDLEENPKPEIIEHLLEKDGIGWLPAPGDNPKDMPERSVGNAGN